MCARLGLHSDDAVSWPVVASPHYRLQATFRPLCARKERERERGKERGWKGVTPSEDGRRDATINPELTPSDDDEDDDEDEEESRRRRQREQVRTNCGRLTFGPGDKFDYNEREPRAAAPWLARRALTLRDSTNVFWGRRKRGVRGRERERETYTPDVRRCARAL